MTLPRESSWQEADAGGTDEGKSGLVEVSVVLGRTAAAIDPGDGARHDPSPWRALEARGAVRTLDDFEHPCGASPVREASGLVKIDTAWTHKRRLAPPYWRAKSVERIGAKGPDK